ncbi:MAG: YmdB family metallophosphoesterase, partial [Clostridia bacterium]|nr:YmdB family metallophosphoesterase [Clostridia bacterium]
MIFRILALGDVSGPTGVKAVTDRLYDIRRDENIDFVVCNGENSAATNGIDARTGNELIKYGVDCITTGNHVFKRREIREYLDETKNIVRPGNFPPEVAGVGYTILPEKGLNILIMNVLGVVYLEPLACPFRTVEKMLRAAQGKYDISVLDVHAEATSEKIAMSHYFDGKIDIIFGTHTHVQTADERIMPKGTG